MSAPKNSARWQQWLAAFLSRRLRCTSTTRASGCAHAWSGWARASRPQALQLASMLRARAARSGCYQSPQPFHPHITLLRDAGQAVAIPPPGFHWDVEVNNFALYESVFTQGRTRYTPLQRWSLGDTLRNSDEV